MQLDYLHLSIDTSFHSKFAFVKIYTRRYTIIIRIIIFSKILNLQQLEESYQEESVSEDKTKTIRNMQELNKRLEAKFLFTVERISTRKKSPYKIFRQRRYKKLLVSALENNISYLDWIRNKEFYRHNMKPFMFFPFSNQKKLNTEIHQLYQATLKHI